MNDFPSVETETSRLQTAIRLSDSSLIRAVQEAHYQSLTKEVQEAQSAVIAQIQDQDRLLSSQLPERIRSAVTSDVHIGVLEEAIRISKVIPNQFDEMRSALVARLEEQDRLLPPHVIRQMTAAFEQTKSQLAQASDFARASSLLSETLRITEQFKIPAFDFPSIPVLTPDFFEIDWEAATQRHQKAVIRMADRGWTVASWIGLWDLSRLADASDEETDDFFVQMYLGSEGDDGELKATSSSLLTSPALAKWATLLQEVFDCLQLRKYRVCVPSLISIIEGFTAESLAQKGNGSRRDTNVANSLAKTKWHEDATFNGLLWDSAVIFLNHLFQSSDFEASCPSFINRHWIQHGRSDTDWTVADALRLVNALALLHWLFE